MKRNNGNSCNCIADLIRNTNKTGVSFRGLAIAYQPDGSSIQGLLSVRPPVIVGGRKRIAIMAFSFCPFCGKRLVPEQQQTEAKIK